MSENLWKHLEIILRPLIRLLIAGGVNLPQLIDRLKRLYVEVAINEFPLENKKITDARIYTLTGVHRRDIIEIKKEFAGKKKHTPVDNLFNKVSQKWRDKSSRYCNSSGVTKKLPIREAKDKFSFESLVKIFIKQDISYRTLFDQWVAEGKLIPRGTEEVELAPPDLTESLHELWTRQDGPYTDKNNKPLPLNFECQDNGPCFREMAEVLVPHISPETVLEQCKANELVDISRDKNGRELIHLSNHEILSQIYSRWMNANKPYTNESGDPLDLPPAEALGTPAFETLLKELGPVQDLQTVMNFCIQKGAVTLTGEGKLQLNGEYHIPKSFQEMLKIVTRSTGDHLSTATKNLIYTAGLPESNTSIRELSKGAVSELEAFSRKISKQAHRQINSKAQSLQNKDDASDKLDLVRYRIRYGTYFYKDQEKPSD